MEGVGTSCFGHSLLALDRQGRPLTPVLSWRDTRSADAADSLLRRVDGDAVHARTGCQIHTSYWPAKLAWLAQEQPDVFRSATRFVSFCDYLYEQLLGREVAAGISMASATGLVDLQTRAWDAELLETLGLDCRASARDLGCTGRRVVSGAPGRCVLQLRRRLPDARARGPDGRHLGRNEGGVRDGAPAAT